MLLRSIVACALLLLLGGPARPATEIAHGSELPPFLYTVAKTYNPLAWMHGAERFSSDAAIFISDKNGQHVVVPDFATSADPSVSFDGQRVLFAGKIHPGDSWKIWEISLTDGRPRQVTNAVEDSIRPFYLPDDRVVYARKSGQRYVIEIADLSGTKPLPLTYIPTSAIPADVLRDGRILFESAYPLGVDGNPEIYAVYSDGSGIESYRCDHGPSRQSARQSSSGDIIFATAHGLAKFTSARAQQVSLSSPAGEYADGPTEIAAGDWLVPWRSDAKQTFHLVRWSQGLPHPQPVVAQNGVNIVQPTLLTERTVPNRHPSGLHDWSNANLLCLNAYTSKYQFAPGSIHAVKLYTRDTAGNTRLLGTAPVERDGSFFVQVPADQPLQIELLDAAGRTLKRESGFFWMRRGEQRGCVGCHAGPETAPENAIPMVLLKSTTPVDMTGATVQSAGGH